MSLLLLTVTLRAVSNKHCLLPLFSFVSDLVGNPEDRFSHNEAHIARSFHGEVVKLLAL